MNPDNIYYNIEVRNKEGTFDQLKYSENRTIPILNKADDYELAVVRFNLPAQLIPIFIWPGNNTFFITLEYNNTVITKYLQFIPNSSGSDFYGDTIWEYQELITIMNKALTDAFTDLQTAEPTIPINESPFITLNQDTRLCILYTHTNFFGSLIKLNFSNNLYTRFFNSFWAHYIPVTDTFEIQLQTDQGEETINGISYFLTKQSFSTLALWSDIKSIIFQTFKIPVQTELEQGQGNVTRLVITDFNVGSDINDRTNIQYFPQGPLRYYDLQSNKELREIDLFVNWEDKKGKTYPLYIQDNEVFTMKIKFTKKK